MDFEQNLVSIIMPGYNSAYYICQAIDSVLNQTYENWELLITDDSSSDKSVAVVESYHDERIRLFVLPEHCNAAAARNNSILHAKGRYIAFLDSDDYWDSRKLELQLSYMKDSGCSFCCHSYYCVDVKGNVLSLRTAQNLVDYDKCLRMSNPIGNLTVMFDRNKLGTILSPDIRCRNDFAMWLEILRQTDFCHGMKDVLAYHRCHVRNSLSYRKIRMVPYHWCLYREIEGLSFPKSIYYMLCWAKKIFI